MAKYFALLTNRGATKLAQAAALGTKVNITQMAVGDGGGTLPTPSPSQTALIGEKRRAAINMLSVDAVNTNQIIAEQVIPEDEGGWWIREIGLYDSDGELIAIANCAETYKPLLAEGSGRTQTIRMILIVSSTDAVTIKIDPSVVLATRLYADNLISVHMTAADPHPQYALKASTTLTGTPKAPTPASNDNSTQIATTAFVRTAAATLIDAALKASPSLAGTPTAPTPVAGNNSTQVATTAFVATAIAALAGSAPETLDTLKEIADALGNDPNFATTMLTALAGKIDLATADSRYLKQASVGYALIDFSTVTKATRTVKANPFGNNTPVITRAEIQLNGQWSYPGFIYSSGSSGYGTEATYVEGLGIVVQTGIASVTPTDSGHGGSGIPGPGSALTSAPCRVHVWKLQP